jgi:hypothetical protein
MALVVALALVVEEHQAPRVGLPGQVLSLEALGGLEGHRMMQRQWFNSLTNTSHNMKTISLTAIKVKEIRLIPDDASFVISVLYAQTDADGKEYQMQWSDPIKGTDLPDGIEASIVKVFEKVENKMKLFEGV